MRRLPLALVALAVAFVPGPAAAAPRLPDLRQELPTALTATAVRVGGEVRIRLGFASAVANVGAAPLVVVARRAGAVMDADQVVEDGQRVPHVGVLRYVRSRGHQHWHLLPFEIYELRRASDARLVGGGHKTGFCLGDRYPLRDRKPVPKPLFTALCGLDAPQLRSLREGITPGWADVYAPNLEGQYVDVTGLPAGEYDLVHRVNASRTLRESDYRNDVASLRIRLTWTDGPARPPRIEIVAACPDRARCRP